MKIRFPPSSQSCFSGERSTEEMRKLKRLDMPAIMSGPIAHTLGRFWHVIRPSDSQDVVNVAEVGACILDTTPNVNLPFMIAL